MEDILRGAAVTSISVSSGRYQIIIERRRDSVPQK